MPDKTKIITTSSAQTRLIKNGMVYIQPTIIKKPLKPLFVLFAYGGRGSEGFLHAAKFKKERLQKKYPNAKILPIIEGFTYPHHFKKEWTKLYKELTKPEIAEEYSLWEVHYFGHGEYDSLVLKNYSQIFFNKRDNMEWERLPWHPRKGIFVLHSCRGGAYEDSFDITKIKAKTCLANEISTQQKTRCLGQTTFANFAIDPIKKLKNLPKTTAEEDALRFQYRTKRGVNAGFIIMDPTIERVLWGYALLTGDTYSKMLENKNKYEEKLSRQGVKNPIYPIYVEIRLLGREKQILPCRVFNNGIEEKRIVKVDVFNYNDIEYI